MRVLCTPDGQRFATYVEVARRAETEAAARRAAEQQAQQEAQRAEQESQRTEQEAQRAKAAENELARLRAELKEKGIDL